MPSIVDMERAGWGDPLDDYYYSTHILNMTAGGRSFRVRREAAPLFRALIALLEKKGVNISLGPVDDWSYCVREIRGYEGTGHYSYHAWGLAVDLDAMKNPLGAVKTSFPVDATRRIAEDCSLTWGYDFSGRKDPMHFEFNGSRRDIWKAYGRLRRKHPVLWSKVKN